MGYRRHAKHGTPSDGVMIFHVDNRGNARDRIFDDDADYDPFEKVLKETQPEVFVRMLSDCLMPNHCNLILWSLQDGNLGRLMQRLTTKHVRRWYLHHHSVGTGHLCQGTYKSFSIKKDAHLDTVLLDVERNDVQPTMVKRAEDWTYCFYSVRTSKTLEIWELKNGRCVKTRLR